MYLLAKSEVALNRTSTAQKQAKTGFCRKLGVIPSMISLSQNWLATVGVTVIAMYRRTSLNLIPYEARPEAGGL